MSSQKQILRPEDARQYEATSNADIHLVRAQDWKTGLVVNDAQGRPLFKVRENQNDGTEVMPQFRVFLGDDTGLIAASKFQPGFGGAYYQMYLKYPTYEGQLPALRVSGPSNQSYELFLWAKLQGNKVRKIVGPKKEEPFMTWKKEEGGKCCCSGSTRVRVTFCDATTNQKVMMRDQINDQLIVEAGQNILLCVLIAWALDRSIKFTGSKVEKKSRGTSAMRVRSAFGLVGAVAAVSIDAARGKQQHGQYHFEVLNKIK